MKFALNTLDPYAPDKMIQAYQRHEKQYREIQNACRQDLELRTFIGIIFGIIGAVAITFPTLINALETSAWVILPLSLIIPYLLLLRTISGDQWLVSKHEFHMWRLKRDLQKYVNDELEPEAYSYRSSENSRYFFRHIAEDLRGLPQTQRVELKPLWTMAIEARSIAEEFQDRDSLATLKTIQHETGQARKAHEAAEAELQRGEHLARLQLTTMTRTSADELALQVEQARIYRESVEEGTRRIRELNDANDPNLEEQRRKQRLEKHRMAKIEADNAYRRRGIYGK